MSQASQAALTVAFLHAGPDLSLPTILVQSVRRAMPGARVLQLSDEETEAVPGVDQVDRRPWDRTSLMTFRMEHYAALPADGARHLFLDTDIVVQADVSVGFDLDGAFDVAMNRRESTLVRPPGFREFPELLGQNLATLMPYNTGVIFSRNPAFWQVALEHLRSLEPRYHRWFGDQVAVRMACETGRFKVLDLHPAFNHTPRSEDEDVSKAYVVHYKGVRKDWMRARQARGAG